MKLHQAALQVVNQLSPEALSTLSYVRSWKELFCWGTVEELKSLESVILLSKKWTKEYEKRIEEIVVSRLRENVPSNS